MARCYYLDYISKGFLSSYSNDEYELQEVNNKLGALKKAIEMAEKM